MLSNNHICIFSVENLLCKAFKNLFVLRFSIVIKLLKWKCKSNKIVILMLKKYAFEYIM